MERPLQQWDRVKAVKEGDQCLYSQRYGTAMERAADIPWLDVLLDGFARVWYREDQLELAEPQR